MDSVMDYCNYMLKKGGGCEQSLPAIYKLYEARRAGQCGDGSLYPSGIYKNPHNDGDRIYVISVAYDALGKFIKADGDTYKCFVFLVLLLWLLALVNELRELIKLGEFCVVFPSCGPEGGAKLEKDGDDEKITIEAISSGHRGAVVFLVVMRFGVMIYLGSVGCVFLINETGYMDLLMNAVALSFILEIDEILFGAVATSATQGELESTNPIEFETKLPTKGCAGWVLQRDFWALVVFPIVAVGLILYHSLYTTKPALTALNCACYQTGDRCSDAQIYGKDWWNNYFSTVLPSVVKQIKALKDAAGGL
jgi:hypothetical protein